MKRMYYLTASLGSTERISNDLHHAGITDWNFHVHSKDAAGLYRRHIHSANAIQKLDVIRHGERGAMIGFAAALAANACLMLAKPFGDDISNLTYIAVFGFITLFGAWAGGLSGMMTENQKIAQYHDDLEAGKYLILIDVSSDQEASVKQLMQNKHPEAELMRVGSTLINPFKFSSAES